MLQLIWWWVYSTCCGKMRPLDKKYVHKSPHLSPLLAPEESSDTSLLVSNLINQNELAATLP